VRTKLFMAMVSVSAEFLTSHALPHPEELVYQDLNDQLEGPFRGPRGGRYEAIGEVSGYMRSRDFYDLARNTYSFRAERLARYVRPKPIPRRTTWTN